MSEILDTIEVHYGAPSGAKFDTSRGDTSVTIQLFDSGEAHVIAEAYGTSLDQTIPNVPRPYNLFFVPYAPAKWTEPPTDAPQEVIDTFVPEQIAPEQSPQFIALSLADTIVPEPDWQFVTYLPEWVPAAEEE